MIGIVVLAWRAEDNKRRILSGEEAATGLAEIEGFSKYSNKLVMKNIRSPAYAPSSSVRQ